MKRKLLVSLLAATACLVGAFGLTACNNDKTDDTAHTHNWSAWTVSETPKSNATGKATRTCSGTGDCNGTATDKEYTLPELTSADYTLTGDTATCIAVGTATYAYNKSGVSVSFTAATPINANAHAYTYTYTDGTGHWQVCGNDNTHTTTKEAHDTNGTDGTCSKCTYKDTTPPAHTHTPGEWVKTDEAGHYKLCTDTNCPNPTEKIDADTHNTNGDDGACSVCGYKDTTTTPVHTHTPSGWVNTDSEQHYKTCTDTNCPNPAEKIDADTHNTNGTDGACSVCGYKAPVPADAEFTSNDSVTINVGGGKTARVNAYAVAAGWYTFTYEGDNPITIAYNYYVLGTGTIEDSVTLSWEGEHSFTAQLSTKATCWMVITSDNATAFNATITKTFSDTDPTPAKTLNLGTATTVNATYAGVVYEYTAETAGNFTLACTDSKAVILLVNTETPLELPYSFALTAGQKISFLMGCNDISNPTATYSVTLTTSAHTHDWEDWEVTKTPTATEEGKATRTCNGTGDCDAKLSLKEYTLPNLESDDYSISNNTATVDASGTATYTYNKNGVSVSFTAETPTIESQTFTITLTSETAGVTVKLGKYTAQTNASGVATVKAEKKDYDVVIENSGYSFTAAQVTVANPTATVKLPTAISGNTSDHIGVNGTITSAGIYTTMITAMEDAEIAGKYTVAERYFAITCADEAKTYTIKILSANTTIAPDEAGCDTFTGVGESYTIVLEEGANTIFNISSNDENITANYSYKVVFEVIESDAPEAGVKDRPIRTEVGADNGKAVSGADEKVYFRLDYATFGKYAKVTFGNGVTVYSLGANKNNAGEEITSEEVIRLSQHSYQYLYATSTGADCKITLEKYFVDGMKEKPFTITLGADNSPVFDSETDTLEQWYKLQVGTDGTYVIKPDAIHAILEVYDADDELIREASGGATIALNLVADTPVYIRATSNDNETYTFVARVPGEEDRGLSQDLVYTVTESCELPVYNAPFYGQFAPTANSKVTLSYNGGKEDVENFLIMYVYSDDKYSAIIINSTTANTLTFYAFTGETYYIKTIGDNASGGTLDFNVEALQAHDYVITVTDGTITYDGVTVTIMKDGEEVEGATGTTANDGKVTFTLTPYDYTVKLTGLPEDCGYFSQNMKIAINNDKTTNFDAKVYAKQTFTVTVKLPDGTTGAEGITVTFTNAVTGTFTATTNASGVASITQLPPMATKTDGTVGTGSYTVTLTLTNYSYNGSISLTASAPSKEVTLTVRTVAGETTALNASRTETALLTDGDNNVLKSASSTDDYFKFTFTTSGTYTITITDISGTSGNYISYICIISRNRQTNWYDNTNGVASAYSSKVTRIDSDSTAPYNATKIEVTLTATGTESSDYILIAIGNKTSGGTGVAGINITKNEES